jgi:hypothetical protein
MIVFFNKIMFFLKFQYLQKKKNSIRFPDKIQQFILKRKFKKIYLTFQLFMGL